ncbi:MAG TPA: RNA 2',3'-cyclic phosphodiesterase [Chloroflexota bacterium]|nr:RNA 2',3'-cyclic phosphodiesterase [Chloroflexota bacterium]
MLRTFVALELPPEVRRLLAETQASLRPATRAVRWVDSEGAHLTLKFLGPTPEDAVEPIGAALRAAADGHGAIRLRTGQPGAFPNPRAPRVLWLGLEGDVARLGQLQQKVEAAIAPLGYPTEARPFSPHLTLGRLRQDATGRDRTAAGAATAAAASPRPVAFEIDAVSLMLSELSPQGARYSPLLTVPL